MGGGGGDLKQGAGGGLGGGGDVSPLLHYARPLGTNGDSRAP